VLKISKAHRRGNVVRHTNAAAAGIAARRSPLAGLGRKIARRPWRAAVPWVIAAVAVLALSPALPAAASLSSARLATLALILVL
jgi:hypothetical protein